MLSFWFLFSGPGAKPLVDRSSENRDVDAQHVGRDVAEVVRSSMTDDAGTEGITALLEELRPVWLLQHTGKFPKAALGRPVLRGISPSWTSSQRFVFAKRMEEAGLSFHDHLLEAVRRRSPEPALADADFHLERLKMYNRLAKDLRLHSLDQYAHIAKQLAEIGRLLGGWKRSLTDSRYASAKQDGARG